MTRCVKSWAGFFLISSFLFSLNLFAERELPVDRQIQLSIQGRDLLLARDYEGAEKFLSKLVNDGPNELLGIFGFMAMYQVRNLDNFDFRFDPLYKGWEERGRWLAQRVLKKPGASAWDLLVAGGTLGVSSFYRAHNSRWLTALRDGFEATHAMEKSYQKDSRMVDSLLGVGLYDYWRSHFTRRLRFLPFFPDRRRQGREELMWVMKEGSFASVLAESALTFIDFEEKRYARVIESTDRLLKQYPRNTILRMLQGQAFLALKKYPETVRVFESILSIDPAVTKSYLFIGVATAREGKELKKAREYLEKFLSLEPQAPTVWRRPALENLQQLRETDH